MKNLSFDNPNIFDPSVVVSASAGSGKTFTLTVLVLLALGRMEARPFEIFAATFSEAAAADLRERLLHPLDLLNSFDLEIWGKILSADTIGSELPNYLTGELLEAFRHFGSLSWMDTPCSARSFWRRTRREAELMNVSTLHGMALSLLGTGNIAPDRILEANHPALLRLLRQALRETTELSEDELDFAPAVELEKWAEMNWEKISLGHDAHRDALGLYEDTSIPDVHLELQNALQHSQNAMRQFAENPNLASNQSARAKQYFKPGKILPLPKPKSSILEQIRWAERQSNIFDTEAESLPEYYTQGFREALQQLKTVAILWELRLKQVLIKSLQRFETLKQSRRIATFGDIIRSALEGLNNGSIAIPRPKLLLVDEYQDTSIAQDAFLHALQAERIVRVGDIKQAIYGFRGGTSDLLVGHIESAGDSVFKLPYNFRSAPPIVDLSNIFVNEVWPAIDSSIVQTDGQQISKKSGECPVGAVLVSSQSSGTDLPAFSDWITALSQESGWENLFGSDSTSGLPSTRALLLRQRTKLSALLLSLKKNGIHPYVITKDGFWDSPGVRLLMATLEAFAYPNRALPCSVILRHIVGLSDNELNQFGNKKGIGNLDMESIPCEKRVHATFLQTHKSASTQQIVAHILTQGNLLAIMSAQDAHGSMEPERARRNLAGFLAMIQKLPQNPSIAFSILDDLRRGPLRGDLPSVSQDADLIIQTVHGSKGLEYDDVLLPMLNNRMGHINKGHILTAPESKSLLFAWKLGEEKGSDYKQIAKLVELQQKRDDLNLFYVGLTRAKKRLCLLIQEPRMTKTKPKDNKVFSWSKLGIELQKSNDKLRQFSQIPDSSPRPKSTKPTLKKFQSIIQLDENSADSIVDFDGLNFKERGRLRQEGIEMHTYLQNLLVRWNDEKAFEFILNNPPPVQNARECALQFLDSFKSKGWQHLRRRTEFTLPSSNQDGIESRADLVVWDQNCIHIIDFKHAHWLTKESEVLYFHQLNRYAKALSSEGTSIKGWLVLLKSGEWKEVQIETWPPPKPGF
ncbi:MAG: UvrD-helicase domain-containing protein [Holophagaceae bacterium]|nr:UvrD-helicase domain-containing protein [Holophagaceae bacterium]